MHLKYYDSKAGEFVSLERYTEILYETALAKALEVTRMPKNAMTIKLIAQETLKAVSAKEARTGDSLKGIDEEVMEAMYLVEKERGLR